MSVKSFLSKYSLVLLFVAAFAGCSETPTAQPIQTSTLIPTTVPKLSNTPTLGVIPSVSPMPTMLPTPKLTLSGVIAFTNASRTRFPIALLTLGNGVIQNISQNGSDSLSLSPDGQWLVFDGGIPPAQQSDIYKVKADGSEFTRLTNSPQGKYDVAWSPDGSSIIYAYSNKGLPSDLALISADGQTSRILTATKGSERYPAWSPDGVQIVYLYSENNQSPQELWIMDANGKNARQLEAVPFALGSIDWSPAGDWIAFVSGEKANECGDIYVIKPDGSDLSRLTNLSGCANAVVWSPDGNYLAFIGSDKSYGNIMDGGWQIYVMEFASKAIVAVTSDKEWFINDIDWGLKAVSK